jgi:hypothetical protein
MEKKSSWFIVLEERVIARMIERNIANKLSLLLIVRD